MDFLSSLFLGTSQKPSTSFYSKLEKGLDRQNICFGCTQIVILINLYREHQLTLPSKPQPIHLHYKELDSCAAKCVTCRVFRQAILLNQFTSKRAAKLAANASSQLVYAILEHCHGLTTPPAELCISLRIGNPNVLVTPAQVYCRPDSSIQSPSLGRDPTGVAIYRQVQEWLSDCSRNHARCGNLRWSAKNPTRLVRIISKSEVQLIYAPQRGEPIKYTALSYS